MIIASIHQKGILKYNKYLFIMISGQPQMLKSIPSPTPPQSQLYRFNRFDQRTPFANQQESMSKPAKKDLTPLSNSQFYPNQEKKRPLSFLVSEPTFHLPDLIYKPDFNPEPTMEDVFKPEKSVETKSLSNGIVKIGNSEKREIKKVDPPSFNIFDIAEKKKKNELKPSKLQTFYEELREEEKEDALIEQCEKEELEARDLTKAFSKLDALLEKKKDASQQWLKSRGEQMKVIKQFEYHSHLLNQMRPCQPNNLHQKVNALIKADEDSELKFGFFPQIRGCYMISDKQLFIWNADQPHLSFETLTFQHVVVHAEIVKINTNIRTEYYLLVATSEQIIKHLISLSEGQKYEISAQTSISTDRKNISTLHQTKQGRIFVGGNDAHVSEIHLFSKSILNTLLKGGDKMKKVDQSQSIFEKLNPFSMFKNSEELLVIEIEESQNTNNLFVLVEDQREIEKIGDGERKGYIELFDLGRLNSDFKSVMKIKLTEIFKLYEKNKGSDLNQKQKVSNKAISIKWNCHSNLLKIVFQNGLRISLTFSMSETTYEEYTNSNYWKWNKQDLDQQEFKPIFIGKESLWRIESVELSPLEQAINQYQNIWEYQLTNQDYKVWTPLPTSSVELVNQSELQLDDDIELVQYETLNEHQLFLVTYKKVYYLVSQSINWMDKFLPDIVSVIKLQSNQGFKFQLYEQGSRLHVNLLNENGLVKYQMQSHKDVLSSYLSLINLHEKLNKPFSGELELIDFDFQQFLKNSSVDNSLQSLLSILTSSQTRDSFKMTNLCDFHYKNINTLKRNANDDFSVKQALQKYHSTAKKYLSNEQVTIEFYLDSIQKKAITYFALLSTQADKDDQFNSVGKDQIENLGIDSLFEFLASVLYPYLFQNIFKLSLNRKQLELNIDPSELTSLQKIIQSVSGFAKENKELLLKRPLFFRDSFHDHNEDKIEIVTLEDLLSQLTILMNRIDSGVFALQAIYTQQQIKAFIKFDKESYNGITFYEFLYLGVERQEICSIVEAFISSQEHKPYQKSQVSSQFKIQAKHLIPPAIVDMFEARKMLVLAKLSNDSSLKPDLISQGMKILFQNSLKANLGIVLLEFLKNDLVSQAISFCLKKAKSLQVLQNHILSRKGILKEQKTNALDSLEYQKQDCFAVIIEILQSIQDKITDLRLQTEPKKSEMKQKEEIKKEKKSDFEGINILKLNLKKVKDIEPILKLKENAIEHAIQNSFELFHFALYDYLIKENQVDDLIKLNTPYVKNFIGKMMGTTASELEPQTTKKQNQVILSKMEATYRHLTQIHQYEECFKFIVDHITPSAELVKLEIKERIHWLTRAEGCLEQVKSSHKSSEPDFQGMSKDFYRNKEYCYTILKARDKLRKKAGLKENQEIKDSLAKNDEILSFSLPDVNQTYDIAIRFNLWTVVLRILKTFEYQQKMSLKDGEELQSKINLSYISLIRDNYQVNMEAKKMMKIKKVLLTLFKQYEIYKNPNVTFFPTEIIVRHIEDTNLEYLEVRNHIKILQDKENLTYLNLVPPKDGQFHPFWIIDFILENKIMSDSTLFNLLLSCAFENGYCSINQCVYRFGFSGSARLTQVERLLSPGYLISRWKELGCEMEQGRKLLRQMVSVKIEMEKEFENELLYSKEFMGEIKKFMKKIDATIKDIEEIK